MNEIVVGLNESKGAEHLLGVALREAEVRAADVRVLHLWRPPVPIEAIPVLGYDVACASEQTAGEDFVQDVIASAGPSAGTTVTADVRSGDPGVELAKASEGAALVVVGQRRHGAFVTALIGSTAGYVLHHAHSPVLVVPPQTGPALPWGRIVVAVDGSPGSRAALRWAVDAATRHHCPLLALHAWTYVSTPPWPLGDAYPVPEDHLATLQTWLETEVRDTGVDPVTVAVDTRVVRGYAAGVLLENTGPGDLLVLGSRGHGGFTDLVLGSVASQCAHHARAAVAVIRPAASPSRPG